MRETPKVTVIIATTIANLLSETVYRLAKGRRKGNNESWSAKSFAKQRLYVRSS
jgi:hypothetical protein